TARDYRSHAGEIHTERASGTEPAESLAGTALHDAGGGEQLVVAGRKEYCFRLQYQRTEQLVGSGGRGRLADAANGERSAADSSELVAGRQVDRLPVGLRRG